MTLPNQDEASDASGAATDSTSIAPVYPPLRAAGSLMAGASFTLKI